MNFTWEEITEGKSKDLDKADPKTGLTTRQRLIVQKTWKDACKMGEDNLGVELFDLYFRQNPEFTGMFKALKDVHPTHLKGHPRLRSHGLTVVRAISGVIENLKDAGKTVAVLQKTGKNHVKRNIKPDNFEALQRTIMALMEATMGAEFTPLVKSSWTKALTVIMDIVMQSMKQEELDQGFF